MKLDLGLGLCSLPILAGLRQGPNLNAPALAVQEGGSDTHAETECADLMALVTVDDGDGGTTSDVELYLNSVLVGSMVDDGGGEWSLALPNALPGLHSYRAKRITDLGDRNSTPWAVAVAAEAPTLDAPADEDTVTIGDSLDFAASGTVDDFDANTLKIEFRVAGTLRATANSETGGSWTAAWDTTGAEEATSQAVVPRRYWTGVSGQTGTVDGTGSVDIDIVEANISLPAAVAEGASPTIIWANESNDALSLTFVDTSATPDFEIDTGVTTPYQTTYDNVTPGTRTVQTIKEAGPTLLGSLGTIVVTPAEPEITSPAPGGVTIEDVVAVEVEGPNDTWFIDNTAAIVLWAVPEGTDIGPDGAENPGAELVDVATSATDGVYELEWDTAGYTEGDWDLIPRRHTQSVADGESLVVDGEPVTFTLAEAGFDPDAVTLAIDLIFTDADYNRFSLGTFWGLTGDDNRGRVEVHAGGGGGQTNAGGGGGGAVAIGENVDLSQDAVFSTTGLAGGAANTNAADAVFSGATSGTLVSAQGGRSRTNGGNGGAAASSVGDTKFSGSNGAAGTGNQAGGSGAGSAGSASGTTTPGEPNGGHSLAANSGFAPGAGGGSQTGNQFAGQRGFRTVSCYVNAGAGMPRFLGYSMHRSLAASTTHNGVAMPADIQAGELLVAEINATNTNTITAAGGSGWSQNANLAQQGNVAIWYKTAVGGGADVLNVTLASSGSIEVIVRRLADAGVPEWTATAQAAAANGNPPSHTLTGGAGPAMFIAGLGSVNRPIPTGLPSGYSDAVIVPARANTGALFTAIKYANTASEDPPAWAINSSTMVVYTLAIPGA